MFLIPPPSDSFPLCQRNLSGQQQIPLMPLEFPQEYFQKAALTATVPNCSLQKSYPLFPHLPALHRKQLPAAYWNPLHTPKSALVYPHNPLKKKQIPETTSWLIYRADNSSHRQWQRTIGFLTDFCPDFPSRCRTGQEMVFRMDIFDFL